MDKIFQEKLCKIIDDYGQIIYHEDKRLEGLLKDLCPQHKKEINLVMAAVRNGSAEEMLNYNSTYPLESLLAKLINRLIKEHGINEILAQKTIYLIAHSLKFTSKYNCLTLNTYFDFNKLENIDTNNIQKLKINKMSESNIQELSLKKLSQDFFHMTEKNHIEEVKSIINQRIDVNIKNDFGNTALMIAAREGYLNIANLLIKSGADINLQERWGCTAIILAVQNVQFEMAKLLIEHGADVNIKNKMGQTALMIAARDNRLEITNLLIEHGANVNIKNNNGYTALNIATSRGNNEISKILQKFLSENKSNNYNEIINAFSFFSKR